MANMTPKAKRNRKQRLLDAHGSVCQICGRTADPVDLNIDHKVPKAEGGSNNFENLRLTCPKCNYDRHH